MNEPIVIALISFAGTLVGALCGVLASAKLTNYRLEQLEKKVDRHNGFAVRIPVLEEKIKDIEHRVSVLEKFHQSN